MIKLWTRQEYHNQIGYGCFWKEECPFCKSEEQSGHTVWKWKYWYILHNLFPYSWNDKHLMAVPYKHRVYSHELNSKELLELSKIHDFVRDFYSEEHYFSCTRESMWNRSIEHIHMHFLPWRLQWKYLRKMLEHQGFPIKEDLKL